MTSTHDWTGELCDVLASHGLYSAHTVTNAESLYFAPNSIQVKFASVTRHHQTVSLAYIQHILDDMLMYYSVRFYTCGPKTQANLDLVKQKNVLFFET